MRSFHSRTGIFRMHNVFHCGQVVGAILAFGVALDIQVEGTEAAPGTALVRHAPTLSGTLEGSLQVMLGENIAFNGSARLSGELIVPGSPTVRLNGHPSLGGTVEGEGSTAPSGYQITLNGGASIGGLRRRVDPVALADVPAPPLPGGSRSVTLNQAGQPAGDWATLKNLTLNGNAGNRSIPPGTYGTFTANGSTGLALGVDGAREPSFYDFQRLTLNGQAQIRVVGPVVVTVANGFAANGQIGCSGEASWLVLNLHSGGLTLNGGSTVHAYVNAPGGTVVVNGNSQLIGGVQCDRLTINGGGLIRLLASQPANQPPVALPISVSTGEDTAVPIVLTGSDSENEAVSCAIAIAPTRGTLSGTAPHLTYMPAPDYCGVDSFSYVVSDGELTSAAAVVFVEVTPVNDAPVAMAASITLDEDGSASTTLVAADVDGDALAFTIVAPPAHGTLTGTAAERTYTPTSDFHGTDRFVFEVADGVLNSAEAAVELFVAPVNDAPVASNIALETDRNLPIGLTLAATDVDGDALTYAVTMDPQHGTLEGTSPNLVYKPAVDFAGDDSFTFTAADGQAISDPGTIAIKIRATNRAPSALAALLEPVEDTPLLFTLTASDPDGDSLGYFVETQPAHGSLAGLAPNLTYTPDTNYTGGDEFRFVANDGTVDSAPATIAINVIPRPNQPPVVDAGTDQTVIVRFACEGSRNVVVNHDE